MSLCYEICLYFYMKENNYIKHTVIEQYFIKVLKYEIIILILDFRSVVCGNPAGSAYIFRHV